MEAERRAGTAILILACTAALLGPVAAANAALVRGKVRDTTCYGPCTEPAPPAPLYGGDNAEVTITEAGDPRHVVSQIRASEGRFHFRLAPGRYVAAVRIEDGGGNDRWTSDSERFRARRGKVAHVTLEVANTAIVRARPGTPRAVG